jgi:hypothetical protein
MTGVYWANILTLFVITNPSHYSEFRRKKGGDCAIVFLLRSVSTDYGYSELARLSSRSYSKRIMVSMACTSSTETG